MRTVAAVIDKNGTIFGNFLDAKSQLNPYSQLNNKIESLTNKIEMLKSKFIEATENMVKIQGKRRK